MSDRRLLILSFLLLLASPALAYLDPGSGSILAQLLVATFAGAIATIRSWWHKVVGLFGGKKKEKSDEDASESNSEAEEAEDNAEATKNS